MKLGERLSAENIELMRKLALEGKTAAQIGREIDTSAGTVRRYMRDWGIDYKEKKSRTYPLELLQEWDRLHERYGKK